MINDKIQVTGALSIIKTNSYGVVDQEVFIPNLVVTVGKNFIASRMVGTASNVMSHMAIGTGTNTPSLGDTTLQTENARVALTSSTASTNTTVYVGTFGPGVGTGAITEAGILNASTGGILLARTTFAVINKQAGDTITVQWTISIN